MARALLLMVIALFGLGCAGNPDDGQFACWTDDLLECHDFISGFTEATAAGLCDDATATFSTFEVCRPGRVAHCTYSFDGWSVAVASWYEPLTITEASSRCAALGGDFAEN